MTVARHTNNIPYASYYIIYITYIIICNNNHQYVTITIISYESWTSTATELLTLARPPRFTSFAQIGWIHRCRRMGTESKAFRACAGKSWCQRRARYRAPKRKELRILLCWGSSRSSKSKFFQGIIYIIIYIYIMIYHMLLKFIKIWLQDEKFWKRSAVSFFLSALRVPCWLGSLGFASMWRDPGTDKDYWFFATPLKNDGVRQWEGWHPIYEMEIYGI